MPRSSRPGLVPAAVLVLATLASALAAAELAVPYLTSRVNDTAGLLSPEARQRIEQKLAAVEQRTGAQIAVLTIPSLEDEPVEDYAVRVAQTWKLGQGEEDNGVLLLVSKADRKMRIEVGYGLEPELTDLESGMILDDVIRPRFQRGDFDGGIEAGTEAIANAIEGQPVTVAEKPAGDSLSELPVGPRLVFLLIFLVLVGTFSFAAIGSSGCQSWFLYAFLTPFYFAFPSAILGAQAGIGFALAWLIGFPLLKALLGRGRGPGPPRARRSPAMFPWIIGTGGGGWSSRGGWSGGGGGFGGFSGGGGSFGGGGASGSW